LKIQWPHSECEHEAEALKLWDGDGAICLLDHDRHTHALLLEYCNPGLPLAKVNSSDPVGVFVALLPRLWKPAGEPFNSLTNEARSWLEQLPENWQAAGRPCERHIVDMAVDYLKGLLENPQEQFLIHQDLHGENIISAKREPWLVIDPKPLVGEREFSLAPIIRSFELGHSRSQVIGRLDRLTSELGLDRERARRWAICQTMAWSMDSMYARQHLESVEWLIDAENKKGASCRVIAAV